MISKKWIHLCRLVPNNHREKDNVFVSSLFYHKVTCKWWDFYSVTLFEDNMETLAWVTGGFSIVLPTLYNILNSDLHMMLPSTLNNKGIHFLWGNSRQNSTYPQGKIYPWTRSHRKVEWDHQNCLHTRVVKDITNICYDVHYMFIKNNQGIYNAIY